MEFPPFQLLLGRVLIGYTNDGFCWDFPSGKVFMSLNSLTHFPYFFFIEALFADRRLRGLRCN
jgi:hypothetical protein